MIDLAVALTLEEHGFGTYGETIWWNQSPVLDSGAVSSQQGIFVNATTVGVAGDLYADQITISTRFNDVLKQGLYLLNLMDWQRNVMCDLCELDINLPECQIKFENCDIRPCAAINFDAVDSEGHWVKSLTFNVSYKLPLELPPLPDAIG